MPVDYGRRLGVMRHAKATFAAAVLYSEVIKRAGIDAPRGRGLCG